MNEPNEPPKCPHCGEPLVEDEKNHYWECVNPECSTHDDLLKLIAKLTKTIKSLEEITRKK